MAGHSERQALIAELDSARSQAAAYVTALRRDLSIGARLRESASRQPAPWFAGAAVLGLLLSQLPRSRRKVVVKGPALRNDQAATAGKAAFGLAVLKFALDFAKPAIMTWVKAKVFNRAGWRRGTAR